MDKQKFSDWYWKKPLNEEELLQLADITEDQAENSDIGGDSDADDQFDVQTRSSTNTPSSSFLSLGGSSASQSPSENLMAKPTRKRAKLDLPVDFTDYDSDDSIADKTYTPDSPIPLQNTLLSSDDELSEAEEQIVDEFSAWSKTPVPPTRYIHFNFSEETGPRVQVWLYIFLKLYKYVIMTFFSRSILKNLVIFLK